MNHKLHTQHFIFITHTSKLLKLRHHHGKHTSLLGIIDNILHAILRSSFYRGHVDYLSSSPFILICLIIE